MSIDPLALMFKYECFSHVPWNLNEKVYNLEMLLEFQNYQAATHILVGLMPHIMKQTVTALEYLHMNQVVHRDLKPSNILVSNMHYMAINTPDIRDQTLNLRDWPLQ